MHNVATLGKLVTKVTKTAPIFSHSLPYHSVFDKNREKLDFVASILSMLTKSDKIIITYNLTYLIRNHE